MSSINLWFSLSLLYGAGATVFLVRWHFKWKATRNTLDDLNEMAILYRRLVNELQSIGKDEAGVIISLDANKRSRHE